MTITEVDLDKIEARARRAVDFVGDGDWYCDAAAKDLLAPVYRDGDSLQRVPSEVADAFHLAACDPRKIVELCVEVRERRREMAKWPR